jgi:hypothetical protein
MDCPQQLCPWKLADNTTYRRPYHNGNKRACTAIAEQWNNSTWRATQPGAVQWENWEVWPELNQSCLLEAPQSTVTREEFPRTLSW